MRKVIGWFFLLLGLGAVIGFISKLLWPHEPWHDLDEGSADATASADDRRSIDPDTYPRS